MPVAIFIIGLFLSDLRHKLDKQDGAMKELRDELRHKDELDTTRRHNFRNEIMAFVGQSLKELKQDLIDRFTNRDK